MYLAVITLPLLSSIVSGLFGRKIGVSGSYIISYLSILLTTLFAIIAFIEVGINNIPVYINLFRWIDSESLDISWGFVFDTLTVSMLIPVLIVSLLVHVYFIGYMSHYPHNQIFFSYLSLFTFMMIILVTSNNFLLMFVGWEGVGVCSYLLVTSWFTITEVNQNYIFAFFAISLFTLSAVVLLFCDQYFIIGLALIIFIIGIFIFGIFMCFSPQTVLFFTMPFLLASQLYISKCFVNICMSQLGNNFLWFSVLYMLNVIFMIAISLYLKDQLPTKFALILTGIITFTVLFINNYYIDFYYIFYLVIECKSPTMFKFIYVMDDYTAINNRVSTASNDELRARKNRCGHWADCALQYLFKNFNFNYTSFSYDRLNLPEKIRFFEKYNELLLYEIEREKSLKELRNRGLKVLDPPRPTKSFMSELINRSSK